jgi:hypothetical protein
MDSSTEEALKAILTGIAAAEVTGESLIEQIATSLAVAAKVAKDADDSVTAKDLAQLSRWARQRDS